MAREERVTKPKNRPETKYPQKVSKNLEFVLVGDVFISLNLYHHLKKNKNE